MSYTNAHSSIAVCDLDEGLENESSNLTEARPVELDDDFLPLEEDRIEEEEIVNDDNDYGDDQQQKASRAIHWESAVPVNYDSSRDLPPWMNDYVDYGHVTALVALHNEIIAFCKLIQPRPNEIQQRKQLVERFTVLVKSTFDEDEKCQVDVFGSQATELFLPTSDIDISIQLKESTEEAKGNPIAGNNKTTEDKMDSRKQELEDLKNWDKPTGSPLQRLATALREQWLDDLSYLEVIENTRVPLVKFTHAPTNISVDVCFNQKMGPQAAALMHQYMNALPPLRPLTFVLKKFMASRGLNQPYTGGVGSFLLQMMIVSFLQHRERDGIKSRRTSQYNLGALLIEFLELYSTDFNYILTGISVRFDGFFFPKGAMGRKKDFWQPGRPFSLAMENPLDPTYDVGSPSFRINVVQRSFEVAFKLLLCYVSEPVIPAVSILAKILPPASFEDLWERAIIKHNPAYQLHPTCTKTAATVEPPRKRPRVNVAVNEADMTRCL
jgi:non-canonical poly(A) RNA polymerase PAPD5/7